MFGLLLMAGMVVAGIAFAVFWNKIKEMFQRVMRGLKTIIMKTVAFTANMAAIIVKSLIATSIKIGSMLKIAMRAFWYNTKLKKWEERIETTTISAEEVPENIRNKQIENQTIDISDDIRTELSFELA